MPLVKTSVNALILTELTNKAKDGGGEATWCGAGNKTED